MSGFDFAAFGGVCLGPMAGVADSAFRSLCRSHGAGYTVTEMVSAKALCFQDKKSRELMRITPGERPCGIQLFGDEPETMARGAKIALEYEPDFIDINMGCPVPKIAGSGSGAALMKSPDLAFEIAASVVKAAGGLPVTVKIRKGWDNESVNAVEFALGLEAAGVSAVAIHGRTRAQSYAPPVDREIIAKVRSALSIPVIANGGIYTADDALEMRRDTCCKAIMAARGALGNPFIFEQINAAAEGRSFALPSVGQRMDALLEQAAMTIAARGERRGMLDVRKHAAWYIKGLPGAASFRNRAVTLDSLADLKRLTDEVITAYKGSINI